MKILVTFLLDRTGSMESIKDDTIGAFNAYLGGLKQGAEDIDFTFVQFDSQSLDKVCVRQPIAKVDALNDATYQPRAATPLIDAAYKTIKAVEKSLNGEVDKIKVVICIQTDGHENASTEHTWADLNALIKEKTAAGWQFNFMGAGIDAYDQGARMGIMAESTVSYDSSDRAATMDVFASSASNTRAFASGLSASTSYSAAQKSSAGDKFVGTHRSPMLQAPRVQQPASAAKTKHKAVDDLAL
jgi:hypothetical protein